MRKIEKKAIVLFIALAFISSAVVSVANIQSSRNQRISHLGEPLNPDQLQNIKDASPLRQEDPWWNLDWQYRKDIKINHTKVAADQTNFPVLISFISDSDLANKTQANGNDLVFTDQNKNKLNHEIELYNSTTGQIIAWINVTSLSSSVDTIIYMYYGNNECGNQQNSAGTWASNYRMVQHLNETAGIHTDSTMYGNHGMYYGSNQNAAGIIDGADGFIGNFGATGGDYIDCANDTNLNINNAITVSAWIKPNDQTQWNHIVTKGNGNWGTDANRVYQLSIETNESINFIINSDQENAKATTSYHVPIGSWSYVVGTYDRNAVRVYINGVERAIRSPYTAPINNNSVHLRIAARVAGNLNGGQPAFAFDGIIDDVRISDCTRSAAWILTEYNNQYTPSSFYNVGLEETSLSFQNWDTTLHFSASERIYDYVVFGEKTNASDGIDIFDVPKSPPAMPPYLYTMFSTNLTEPYHMLWYEYKHGPDSYKCWNLKVQWVPADYVSPADVTFAWNSSALNNSEYTSVLLENLETNETVDMLLVDSYQFTASALSLHPFKIVCRVLTHVTNPSYSWNFISLPFNQSFDKTNIVIRYVGKIYDWFNATSSGLVMNFICGWNRTGQNYFLTETLLPGEGYWMFFYHDCELLAQGVSVTGSSNQITQLLPLWNIIGLPDESTLLKEELYVLYDGVCYNWTQATTSDNPTSAPLILKFMYGWNQTGQNYCTADSLEPGEGYWLYSYQDCLLLKESS